jgi:hypothetical protein
MTRLNNYITEITRLKDKEAKRMVFSKLGKFEKLLDKKNWQLNMLLTATLLDLSYKNHNLKFSLGTPEDTDLAKQEGRDFFLGASTDIDGEIVLYMSDDVEFQQKIENFKGSQFVKEFIEVLSHELVHREQWLKSGGKLLSKGFDPDMSIRKYLSLKFEVEAHAHDAAVKLHKDEDAPELEVYGVFGKSHPIFKRFMKKVFKFRKELEKRDHEER